ncbi:hypothetical protein OOU_Y34scaffold00491g17 [Pyricularia oryzae Y34]|uniref:Uncharacterized protein n=2 Tax=Pyricularia oryzae TaxID=318829 RepID=A0AA97P0E4_PYRO3|nr:hypothetical protein OOU_Y34scaffold00491g17 [Pyricularia oryzae Y34]
MAAWNAPARNTSTERVQQQHQATQAALDETN